MAEVECRIQLRGSCQACGREQAVVDGIVAQHGFTLAWHYRHGVCSGSRFEPAEVSVRHAENVVHSLRKQADEIERRLVAGGVDIKRSWIESKEIREQIFRVQGQRQHADFVERNVLPRLGNPLRKVPVVDTASAKGGAQ